MGKMKGLVLGLPPEVAHPQQRVSFRTAVGSLVRERNPKPCVFLGGWGDDQRVGTRVLDWMG